MPRRQNDEAAIDRSSATAERPSDRQGLLLSKRPWEEYDSDVDAYIWLCGAYSHARNPVSFCRTYGLDGSRLTEVGALAAQMAQLLRSVLQRASCQRQQAGETAASSTSGKPAAELEEALKTPLRLEVPSTEARRCMHQCFVQGLIDHVAVWQDPPRPPPDATGAQRAAAAARGGYRCAALRGQLAWLHPTSNLLHLT